MKDEYDLGYRLHFAYGADMHERQISERCHSAECMGVAVLDDHQLGFFGYSKRWDGAEEAVYHAVGSRVWGVLYKLGFSDAELLDSWQDVRLDGTGPYFHYPAKVCTSEGQLYPVLLYKRSQQGEAMRPSREYLSFLLDAARNRALPDDYVRRLAAVPSSPAAYPVPRPSRFGRTLLVDHCSGCGGP